MGLIDINLGIENILRYLLKKLGLLKPRLTIELLRHGIDNHFYENPDDPVNSEVEIVLRVSNPTWEKIGIRKIFVESSEKRYQPAVALQEYVEGRLKPISSFVLEPQETKEIRLYAGVMPAATSKCISAEALKNGVQVTVVIYDTNDKKLLEIPVLLHMGSQPLPTSIDASLNF